MEIQGLNDEFLNMRAVNPVADASASSYATDIQTQVRILQSETLIGQVRKKLDEGPHASDLQPPDRLGAWRKALNVSPPSNDELWNNALGTAAGSVRVRATGGTRIVDVMVGDPLPRIC